MNNRAFSRDDSAALIYRFNDTRLNSVSFAGLPQRAGYRHYDCDSCCATDLCAFRELTVLLRTEDVLGIEREWCHSQQWFGEHRGTDRRGNRHPAFNWCELWRWSSCLCNSGFSGWR